MSSFYDRIAGLPGGSRALSTARLRRNVLAVIRARLDASGLSQVELARRLGVRKSAVNGVLQSDGNLRVTTIAEYLHELGAELRIEAVPVGTQRAEAVENSWPIDIWSPRMTAQFAAHWGEPVPSASQPAARRIFEAIAVR